MENNFNPKDRFGISFFLIVSSYLLLYSHLISGFRISPIEIQNTCTIEAYNKVSCSRSFEPTEFFEKLKTEIDEIPKRQNIIQKLGGADPLNFNYLIGFRDDSYIQFIGHPISLPWYRGFCKFPEGLRSDDRGGYFQESFSFSLVPAKLHSLSISLNDCKQSSLFVDIPNPDFKFEGTGLVRVERYDILVQPDRKSQFYLLILAVVMAHLILNVFRNFSDFILKGIIND